MQEAADWELLRQYVQANDDANGGTPSAARETHGLWPWQFQAGWTEAGSTLFSTLFHFGEMCVNRVVIIVWAIASHGRNRGSGRKAAARGAVRSGRAGLPGRSPTEAGEIRKSV